MNSSFSGGLNCVDVELDGDRVLVRSSRPPQAALVLSFTREEWKAFVQGVKAGEFDPEEGAA